MPICHNPVQKKHSHLVEDMEVKDNNLLDYLFENNIINDISYQRIRQLATNSDQVKELLVVLRAKHRSFAPLLRALDKTGQHDVADELRKRMQGGGGKSQALHISLIFLLILVLIMETKMTVFSCI